MADLWRVGRHQPRNLYVGEVMVGVMVGADDVADALAATVVRAMNAPANPASDPARTCEDCGRTARQLIPVLDPQGRTTGWVGPTCLRKRDAKAEHGVQLPLEQEGADRG